MTRIRRTRYDPLPMKFNAAFLKYEPDIIPLSQGEPCSDEKGYWILLLVFLACVGGLCLIYFLTAI